ncbi:MAG: hypothetical protein NVSMB65_01450 [Chloroflexota bacterium]
MVGEDGEPTREPGPARPRPQVGRGAVLGGRYRLVTPVHLGAGASLYLADDLHLPKRQVMIKAAPPKDPDGAKERLTAEARVLAGIRHPGIPELYDVIEDGPFPALVLEHLAGRTLKHLGSGTPRAQAEVLNWGLRLCDVLNFMHLGQPQLAHGAVRAGHCLVMTGGRVVLLDYSAAGPATPGARGGDTRALAVLLYNLLTGADHPLGALPPTASPAGEAAMLERVLRAAAEGTEGITAIAELRRRLVACSLEAGLAWGLCPYCQATTRLGARHCGSCGSLLGLGQAEDAGATPRQPQPPASTTEMPGRSPDDTFDVVSQPAPVVASGSPLGSYVLRLRAVGRYIDQQGLRRVAVLEAGNSFMVRGQTDGVGQLAHHAVRTTVSALVGESDLAALLAEASRHRGQGEGRGHARSTPGILGSAVFPQGYEDRLRALGSEIDGLQGVSQLTLIESRDTLFLDYDRTDEHQISPTVHRHLAVSAADLDRILSSAVSRRARGHSLRDYINSDRGSGARAPSTQREA